MVSLPILKVATGHGIEKCPCQDSDSKKDSPSSSKVSSPTFTAIKKCPRKRDVSKRGNIYYKCVDCCGTSGSQGLKENVVRHMKICRQKPVKSNVHEDIRNGVVEYNENITLSKFSKLK